VTVSAYHQLSLDWHPRSRNDKAFRLITLAVVALMLMLGLVLSSIQLPPQPRHERQLIPERIANILLEKKQQRRITPKPKPLPKPSAKPKPEKPPTTIKKSSTRAQPQKPLTKVQRGAREKAASSGLLSLKNQLGDLLDTSDVSAMVAAPLLAGKAVGSAEPSAQTDEVILIASAAKGSGGVSSGSYATHLDNTKLQQRTITSVEQPVIPARKPDKAQSASSSGKISLRSAGVRAAEEVTLVFDRNKGILYKLYNHARRKNPGLKGKIVLRLTIAPSGKVNSIEIVSSELNDPKLETRLVRRIRNFDFGAKNVESMSVTYPIEFLPS
jgi:TonB family protein